MVKHLAMLKHKDIPIHINQVVSMNQNCLKNIKIVRSILIMYLNQARVKSVEIPIWKDNSAALASPALWGLARAD